MGSRSGEWSRPHKILVIANETCASKGVVDEVRYRAGERGEVLVVAPALARTRLEHWLTSDLERRQAEAGARMESSLAAFGAAGLNARGHLGDADPLQALDDALRIFAPDEVIISTHPPARSSWLERHVVRRARERYDLPITHVVVDLEHESVTPVESRPGPITGADRRVRLFHASDYEEAMEIRSGGFRDRPNAGAARGVLLSDRPPATQEAGDEWVVFAVDLPEDVVSGYEQSAEGEARRYLLPAELVNRHGPPVAEGDWSE